jgi:hypothetical protein
MSRTRVNWQDLLFGLFLVAVSTGTLYASRLLAVGTAAEMGPGYMPRAIALGLLAFGLFFCGRGALRAGAAIEPARLRPLLAVLAAVAVFAASANRLGLVVASVATVLVAALATRESRPVETVLFALALSAAAVLLFVRVLGLPVPVWPR